MQISIKIKNINQIRAAFRQAPAIVRDETNKAINRSILGIKAFVQTTTLNEMVYSRPESLNYERTYNLRNRWDTSFGNFVGRLWPMVNYAIYVHEGTRYMESRPFLKEGAERYQRQLDIIWGDLGKNIVNKIANKI